MYYKKSKTYKIVNKNSHIRSSTDFVNRYLSFTIKMLQSSVSTNVITYTLKQLKHHNIY